MDISKLNNPFVSKRNADFILQKVVDYLQQGRERQASIYLHRKGLYSVEQARKNVKKVKEQLND